MLTAPISRLLIPWRVSGSTLDMGCFHSGSNVWNECIAVDFGKKNTLVWNQQSVCETVALLR